MKLFSRIINFFKSADKCHTIIQIHDNNNVNIDIDMKECEDEKKIHDTLEKTIDDIFVDVPLAKSILFRKLGQQGSFYPYSFDKKKKTGKIITSVKYFNDMDVYAFRYAEMLQNLHGSVFYILKMFDIPTIRFPRTYAEFFEMLNSMTLNFANMNENKKLTLSTLAANANIKIIFLMIVYGKTYQNMESLILLRNKYVATLDEYFMCYTMLKKGEKDNCCICFDKTAYIPRCRHSICKNCFKKWISIRRSCPLCTISYVDEKFRRADTFDNFLLFSETLNGKRIHEFRV